jgi:CRISPR/Cas system-associated endonuclease Cas1
MTDADIVVGSITPATIEGQKVHNPWKTWEDDQKKRNAAQKEVSLVATNENIKRMQDRVEILEKRYDAQEKTLSMLAQNISELVNQLAKAQEKRGPGRPPSQ